MRRVTLPFVVVFLTLVAGCRPATDPTASTCDGGSCRVTDAGCAPGGTCPVTDAGCTPDCTGKACGFDGCSGFCGNGEAAQDGCPAKQVCTASGTCEAEPGCTPDCVDKACGSNGCGGFCGNADAGTQGCPTNQRCTAAATCEVVPVCMPSCAGKGCGLDGCGGVCGTGELATQGCPANQVCSAGSCLAVAGLPIVSKPMLVAGIESVTATWPAVDPNGGALTALQLHIGTVADIPKVGGYAHVDLPVTATSHTFQVPAGSAVQVVVIAFNAAAPAGRAGPWSDAVTAAWPSTVVVNPGESIQAAMDKAQSYAKSVSPTWPNHTQQDALFGTVILKPGLHYVDTPLKTRAHVRIEAAGAEVIRRAGSHLMVVDDNGGGGYKAPATYWTIVGGVWNANGGGGFSIVHTLKFTLRDLEIKDIGYKAHHLEINSSGGPYQPGVANVLVDNVRMHGVAAIHRLEDEAINIDYSWVGAAVKVAGDGTVTNNVMIRNCEFYDVPRAVSSHRFQSTPVLPKGKMSGITIQGGRFHDIDPSLAEAGAAFENDGAIRVYGWQNVLVEGVTFTNCATAVSLYAAADYPLSSPAAFTVRNNTFTSCGRAKKAGTNVPQITVDSAKAGVNFWDVKLTGNAVTGAWVAGTEYFIAVYDTHNCEISGNRFEPTGYSVAQEKAHNKYTAQGSTNFGVFNLSNNTVSDGTVDNS